MNVPAYCRAAATSDRSQHVDIIDVEIPHQLERGALLVQTSSATICATDVHAWDGSSSTVPSAGPVILGHEATGRIVRFGEDATHDSIGQELRIGDRIVWSHGFCGQCVPCVVEHQPTLCDHVRLYMRSSCLDYPYLTGTFAEYCYVFPTSGRIRVPDDIGDAVASASSCALRTVIQAFDRLGAIDDRHSVVIQGSGPLGLFALAKAVTSGSSNVIVIGGPTSRLELATRWGAHHTIDIAAIPDAAHRQRLVIEMTGGRGADIVMEFSGAPAAFLEGVDICRAGGRYVIVGQVHGRTVPFNPTVVMAKHLTIIGSRGASIDHYHRALEFMRHQGDRFAWSDMITSHSPLSEINAAMQRMQSWQEIKPAIDFPAAHSMG